MFVKWKSSKMWSFDTNWMGPINRDFLKEHGSGWSGGRIDCYYDGEDESEIEYCYGRRTEIGTPIMTNESWNILTDFCETYTCETLPEFDQLAEVLYNRTGFRLDLF